MKTINVVYAYMREPRFEVALPERNAKVVWTVVEEDAADVIIYLSGYSYDEKQVAKNPKAFRILYMYEPLVVYPRQFLRGFWKPFDVVLTWSKTLVEQGGQFAYFPSLYYDFPFGAAHGIAGEPDCPPSWQQKKKALCQVAGNKRSFISSELYSCRREIAQWFGKHGTLELDTYGVPAMPVPGYRGRAADKRETLAQYRYALCVENDSHPLWARGYITEKIFDCFYAFTVPVYLGAPDIAETIPANCFIDLRDFASLADLDTYLTEMTDEEYGRRLLDIEQFLKDYNAPQKHSCFQLYDKALELASRPAPTLGNPPFGFWQKASWIEKARCLLMLIALPLYKKIFRTRYAGTK